MANLNKVLLLGNVTRDPEVRYTPKGSAVCDLGIAVNRAYTTDSGEKREEVTFVDVTLWGRTAEVASEYSKKGRPVFIEGRLANGHLGRQANRTKANAPARGGREHATARRPASRQGPRRLERAGKPAHRLKNRRRPEPDEDEIPF